MNNKKIVVVTGGAGFIGSHMVDLLIEKNYEVRVIDNLLGGRLENLKQHKNERKLKFERKNILDIKDNDKIFKDSQFVFHFAGVGDIVPSIENPTHYMKNNIMGTTKVLEASRNFNLKKIIYAASSSCYGLAKTPTNEKHPINPKYPYALSKYFGEQSVIHWGKVYKMPYNSIRIFNAYGTRVKTTGAYGAVFGVFFKQKLSGKNLTVVGDGKQRRDYVYVTDVARAFYLAAISKKINQIYNLGSGNPQSVNTLVKKLNCKVTYISKRPGEPNCTWADIRKIKKDLNWKPKVSFDDGVDLMLKEIHKWKDAPLWNKKKIKKATKLWFKYL